MEEIFKNTWVKKVVPFGSRVVGCATEKSDYDYLVLCTLRPSLDDLRGTDYTPDAEDPLYGVDFSSWKNGNINLVFTDSEDYFNATIRACEFCKKYKVYDKADRCEIHEAFRSAVKFKATTPDIFSIF